MFRDPIRPYLDFFCPSEDHEMKLAGSQAGVAFLDFIPVGSATPEEHLADLVDTIDRLAVANLRINVKKSHFFRTSLHLLKRTFSAAGIAVVRRKLVDVVRPQPHTGNHIKRSLDLINYFRVVFIPCYSTLAAPLESMRKYRS